MTSMRTFALAVLLTLSVQAQEAARIAALVQAPTIDPAPLAAALQSQEPRVRATAARVATVRDVTALVPALRAALESETDAEAAREQVRALALLGSDDDVAFAATQSARFPSFVDEAFADGIARLGVPRALDLYFRHRDALRGATLSVALSHWSSELHVMPTAARLLQARDAASFDALLRTLEASSRTLDPGVATIALASEDAAIREAAERHHAPVVEEKPASRGRVSTKATEIPTPSFRLPFALPRGLGAEILAATRCESGWLGTTMVTTDHAGRVQDIDTTKVRALAPCVDALRTIARLSLAKPTRLGAGTTAPLLVARHHKAPPCFDQSLTTHTASAGAGDVQAPKVRNRVEPVIPRGALRKMKGSFQVEAEAIISADGCVRDVRLVRQSPLAEVNGAMVWALTRWTFTPGTLNGVPVDVLFQLTTSYESR